MKERKEKRLPSETICLFKRRTKVVLCYLCRTKSDLSRNSQWEFFYFKTQEDLNRIERHMRKMRRVYEERRNTMIKALEDLDVEYQIPDGGMALWLNTKVNSTKLSELGDINGVYVTPESYFSLDPKKAGKHIRIGFANQTSREIEEGLKILLKIKKDNF